MSSTDTEPRKPRLALRIFLVLLLLAAIAGVLGYLKMGQFKAMEAQNSVTPPPIAVTVASAEADRWTRHIRAIGTLVADQQVAITSEVPGIITSIGFESGDEVVENDLLVELDNRSELASLESAQASFDSANSQYQRMLQLKGKSFVTSNELDNQASLVDVAEAQLRVAQVALAKRRIFAPFSGRLGIREVDRGDYIVPGAPIVTLQALDRLLLNFNLPESNFNDLVKGQAVKFRVRSYPGRVFEARVKTWNPALDASTRNVLAQAEVDNRERLLAPGMFAELDVESREKIDVLTVPETAIFYNIYGEAAYVLENSAEPGQPPDYRLAPRQLDVAYREGGKAGVVKGLKDGDLVVTSGQQKLYPSLRVAIVDDPPDYQAASRN